MQKWLLLAVTTPSVVRIKAPCPGVLHVGNGALQCPAGLPWEGLWPRKQPFAWVTVLCFLFCIFENALQNSQALCCLLYLAGNAFPLLRSICKPVQVVLPSIYLSSMPCQHVGEGGGRMGQLRRTSQQPSLQFQLVLLHVVGSEVLTIGTSLKAPCETWPCLPCLDTIYVGDRAARWGTCMVSRLWSDRVLGVPLKFHRSTTF